MDNPYWELVAPHVAPEQLVWGGKAGPPVIAEPDWGDPNSSYRSLDRAKLVRTYAWAVPDPATVEWIAKYARGRILDPFAGSGYWGWMFVQAGLDALCFDLTPPPDHEWYDHQFWPVGRLDAREAARLHSDRTLFVCWPPYADPIAAETLDAYTGDRVIYLGESEGGCTGDDQMFKLLQARWTEVASHVPVRWYGLRDYVTVFDRKP